MNADQITKESLRALPTKDLQAVYEKVTGKKTIDNKRNRLMRLILELTGQKPTELEVFNQRKTADKLPDGISSFEEFIAWRKQKRRDAIRSIDPVIYAQFVSDGHIVDDMARGPSFYRAHLKCMDLDDLQVNHLRVVGKVTKSVTKAYIRTRILDVLTGDATREDNHPIGGKTENTRILSFSAPSDVVSLIDKHCKRAGVSRAQVIRDTFTNGLRANTALGDELAVVRDIMEDYAG